MQDFEHYTEKNEGGLHIGLGRDLELKLETSNTSLKTIYVCSLLKEKNLPGLSDSLMYLVRS